MPAVTLIDEGWPKCSHRHSCNGSLKWNDHWKEYWKIASHRYVSKANFVLHALMGIPRMTQIAGQIVISNGDGHLSRKILQFKVSMVLLGMVIAQSCAEVTYSGIECARHACKCKTSLKKQCKGKE